MCLHYLPISISRSMLASRRPQSLPTMLHFKAPTPASGSLPPRYLFPQNPGDCPLCFPERRPGQFIINFPPSHPQSGSFGFFTRPLPFITVLIQALDNRANFNNARAFGSYAVVMAGGGEKTGFRAETPLP